jgi:hypothetical protein
MAIWTKLMDTRMRFALLISGLLLSRVFGGECFCLVNADDDVWFDCREQTRPLRTQPLVFCLDATTGKQIELTGRRDLARVADGDAPCIPCRLSDAAKLGRVIRGGNEGQEALPDTATQPGNQEGQP